jgi:hypothetical protein
MAQGFIEAAEVEAAPGRLAKTATFTRDMSLASGTQAITGVGFTPIAILFWAKESSVVGVASWGFTHGSTNPENMTMRDSELTVASAYVGNAGGCIHVQKNVPNTDNYRAFLTTFDSDGFTLTWTRTGTPTGTLTVNYLAIR